jgi:flagellar biosynthesis protein FlhF
MRIKTFRAASVKEALAEVKAAMGEDAIIISSFRSRRGRGVEITAALEPEALVKPKPALGLAAKPPAMPATELAKMLAKALAWHGVSPRLNERLCLKAAAGGGDPTLALASALDGEFAFQPLPEPLTGRFILIGPSGAGKTASCAKLAARLVIAGQPLKVISADTVRAGALDQLAAFTNLMGLELAIAADAREMAAQAASAKGALLIDTPGVNPYSETEIADVRDFVRAANAEPLLVLPAGGDANEAADVAAAFAKLDPKRLLPTKLDAARRFGGILAAASTARLAFADAGISPFIAQGLAPLNPVSLARVLLADPGASETQFAKAKAL